MTRSTRQDPPSPGHPRLVFALGGQLATHDAQREFALLDATTTIGSSADADLRLADLESCHAEIRLDDRDNFTYIPLCAATSGSVHGRNGVPALLRTGTVIQFGSTTVSFYREEFADGGTPRGSVRDDQPMRLAIGTRNDQDRGPDAAHD